MRCMHDIRILLCCQTFRWKCQKGISYLRIQICAFALCILCIVIREYLSLQSTSIFFEPYVADNLIFFYQINTFRCQGNFQVIICKFFLDQYLPPNIWFALSFPKVPLFFFTSGELFDGSLIANRWISIQYRTEYGLCFAVYTCQSNLAFTSLAFEKVWEVIP